MPTVTIELAPSRFLTLIASVMALTTDYLPREKEVMCLGLLLVLLMWDFDGPITKFDLIKLQALAEIPFKNRKKLIATPSCLTCSLALLRVGAAASRDRLSIESSKALLPLCAPRTHFVSSESFCTASISSMIAFDGR